MSKKTATEYRAKIKEYLEHITSEKDLAFLLEIVADIYQTERL